MDKAVNTLVDLIQGKTVNIGIHANHQRILEHPTPTTYVWHMGHNEHVEMKRAYSFNRNGQRPKVKLEFAYEGVRK